MASNEIKVSYSDVINAQQKIHSLRGCMNRARVSHSCMYRDNCQSNSCFNEFVENHDWSALHPKSGSGEKFFNISEETAERIRQINGPYGHIIYKAWLIQEEERLKYEQEIKTYNAQTNARIQKSPGEG